MKKLNNYNRVKKWTDEDIANFRKLLVEGKTLQELATENGISRQRMAQIVGAVKPMREWNKTYSVYPAIDSWMKYHRVTYASLTKMLGYAPSASAQYAVKKRLMGEREMYKGFIDALLNVMGATYEEVFRKEESNVKSNSCDG